LDNKKCNSKKGFHNTSIGTLSDNRFRKRYNKKIQSFFLSDPQIRKEDRLVISLNDTNNQRKG
jgi:hypothetical protein